MLFRIEFLILTSLAVLVNATDGVQSLPFPLKPLDIFSPTYRSVQNQECRRHSQTYLKDLTDLKLWAVEMYDASGKIPSGLLRGNVQWLGDAKECYAVSSKPDAEENDPDNIKGQYCTVSLFVGPSVEGTSTNSDLLEILDLIHTHNILQNSPNDRILFLPSFTPLTLGLCIPRSCELNDLEEALKEWVSPLNSSSSVQIQLVIRPDSCTKEEISRLNRGTISTIVFFLAMTLLGIAGSLYERSKERTRKTVEKEGKFIRAFLAFSFRSNTKVLLDTSAPSDDIGCLHGIRTIFALFLYMLHKAFFSIHASISNREDIAELLYGPKSMLLRSFWNNVDTFVVLSGLLTSYYSVKRLQEGRKLNIFKMYFQRYIKFTPLFFVCVVCGPNLTEFVVSDAHYTRLLQELTRNCREAWWDVLTYTNTRRGFNDMCYHPSHQLETDMHMYLLSPFLILILWKMKNFGVLCFTVTIAFLSALKYYVVLTEKLATVIYYGISLQEIVKSADFIYLNFVQRLVPYLSGVLLGYFLRVRNQNFKFSKLGLIIGSAAAIFGTYYSFYSMHPASLPSYVYNPYEAAIFGTLQPLLWSYSICWLITICAIGQAEWIDRKLKWKGFQVTSKLTYAFYLSQIPVIVVDLGRNPNPCLFTPFSLFDLNVFMTTLAFTFWLTLMILLPIINLWKIFAEEGLVDFLYLLVALGMLRLVAMPPLSEMMISSPTEGTSEKTWDLEI